MFFFWKTTHVEATSNHPRPAQVGDVHKTLADSIKPSTAPVGRRLTRSTSQGEIPEVDKLLALQQVAEAAQAAAAADTQKRTEDHPSTGGSMLKHLMKKGTPRGRAATEGTTTRGRAGTDAAPKQPPSPPLEGRSLLRLSRLLTLSREDLWAIAEDKLMESYDVREACSEEGKPSLDVAQVSVTLGSLQMDMGKIDAARAYRGRKTVRRWPTLEAPLSVDFHSFRG